MKPDDGEARIRDALAEAHRADAARMPSFERVWAAAGRTGPTRHAALPWLLTCASLASALGLSAWLVGQLGPPPAKLPTGAHWSYPTDFLLSTPGLVTMRTVPELGATSSYPPLHSPVEAARGKP
jgi:hypothetical protein